MWKNMQFYVFKKNNPNTKRIGIVSSFICTILMIIFLAAIIPLTYSGGTGYTNTTNKCISCHNDSTFPNDTDGDGVAAPYKRPHNNNVMCESCHRSDPHLIAFIQLDGNYGSKSTAASCPECHQTGIPVENNSNFTAAFNIYSPLSHSSNIQNGSAWGNYWTNTEPKAACIFCHSRTLHDVTALGRILEWSPNYIINSSIGANYTCSNCHFKGDANWTNMKAAFIAAGLEIPPEITNGTNWNGTSLNYFNHSIDGYTNDICKRCHGRLLSENATMSEFVHNVAFAESTACIGCHTSPTGVGNMYAAIDAISFGKHKNINSTDGENVLTDSDCMGCHYNISNMYASGFTTETRICTDCHRDGNFSAPIISNHKPPKVPVTTGGKISTTAYCTICHDNSINKYVYSVNASVGHYGTNVSLVKTVNQTQKPKFGFVNQTDAQQYNKECNNCHNPSNSSYGNATLITMPHIRTGTCNECHINGSSTDLHKDSLGLPVTFRCIECHTTYAKKYGAPDLTGTSMAYYTNCDGGQCHGTVYAEYLNSRDAHNVDRTYAGTPGTTDTVYLNGVVSLIVTKGAIVDIASRVNDVYMAGGASRIAGAEYYIDTDPGQGKGIPMDAEDGNYDATQNIWERVKATIETNSLSNGPHTIYVRGMDIGKQWSTPKNAVLIVQSLGYFKGTVTNGTSPIQGALVYTNEISNITDANGNYSLLVTAGLYNVTASMQPTHNDSTSLDKEVTPNNTTIVNFVLDPRPKGTITGVVRNA